VIESSPELPSIEIRGQIYSKLTNEMRNADLDLDESLDDLTDDREDSIQRGSPRRPKQTVSDVRMYFFKNMLPSSEVDHMREV